MNTPDAQHKEREHFFAAAKVVTGLTVLSRILGMLRDIAMLSLGGPKLADAFWTAFRIPNLFRRLFGEGALSAAFVPVFTEVGERDGWDRARTVLANVGGALSVLLAGLVILLEVGLLVGGWLWPGDWFRTHMYQYAGIMAPYMLTVCLLALGSAALNCKGRFAAAAAMPIAMNVGLIATAWWIAPALASADAGQFFALSVGLLLTSVGQLVVIVWLVKRNGLLSLPRLRPFLPETGKIARRMLPMLIPLSVLQLSALADTVIALNFAGPGMPLPHGVVRCLYAASRFYYLPLGVMGLSIATVVFPLFSRYAARGDTDGLRDVANRALRLCVFLAVASGVGLFLLAEPIIVGIIERKGFRPADSALAAPILQMYCLGMLGYFCNHILLRVFFARNETRTPLLISSTLAAVNIVLVLIGIQTPLRARAIGLATAVTQSVSALCLVVVLRKRLGTLGGRRILLSAARIVPAVAVMGAVVWYLSGYVSDATADWGRIGSARAVVAVGVAAGAVVFLIAALVCRCPELRELLGPRKRLSSD